MGLNYEKHKEWLHTPNGRASTLLNAYNHKDIAANREKGDLTAKWIVENIFTKPCAHCGKEGWQIIGCNHLDNDKPHTTDNVEPCCMECNNKLNWSNKSKTVLQKDLESDEVVASFSSANEAARKLGIYQSGISNCCNGVYRTYKGYKWSYKPL
jgi:hypothetical protein